MTRSSQWWARQAVALPEFGTARMAGLVAAVLFVLCGLLVADFGALIPRGPRVHPGAVVVVGLAAIVTGFAIGALPWQRWKPRTTLWLVPLALVLIACHNVARGGNGLRYNVFFFVVFVWVGLMHPSGTSVVISPLVVVSYLAPGLWLHDTAALAAAMTYALPVGLLAGECASLVAARIRHSDEQLRASEARFRALVQHSADVITVLDRDGLIRWESASITAVLGYAPHERIGRRATEFVNDEQLAKVRPRLHQLPAGDESLTVEVELLHKNGSWRWCEARVTDLLDDPAVGGIIANITDVTTRHHSDALQRRLAAIVESSNEAITAQLLDGTVTAWNPAAERMYGYRATEIVGKNIRAIVPGQRQLELDDMLARAARGENVAATETQRVRRDGTVLDVSLSLSPVRDSSGNVVAVSAITRDVTDDVRARRALADREASFRLLFAANPQPMWVYDAHTLEFVEVNDAAVEHYGHSREAFLTMRLPDVVVGELNPECQHRLANGRLIDVAVTAHELEFGGRDAVLAAVQDVTERNALEDQLRHQAFHDSLTGLANRALFGDRVEHALARRDRSPHVVLLLDLDRFKLVNDSLGHAVGDELLVEAARRLHACVRTGDTVARLGGDEFAILLEDADLATAERQAARLLRALDAPMTIGGHSVVATASIGIARADLGVTAGDLLRNADVAMYRAKATGGGRFKVFQPAMHAAAARQLEITAAMRHGLARGEFVLHFQPVVDVASGAVTSLEALVRWRHPELGLLQPAEFIPIAEDAGLILELGAWVLHESCVAAASWPTDAGVNVNISGRQLADPRIVDRVREALVFSGLEPSRLTLEITEGVVMQHSEANMRRLRRLRDLGVSLAVDDFGTGYSSLAYLRAFPVDELKIDKSFVAAMGGDADSLALVRTIVQLAESLSLRTVAEGVETAAQYDALRALGCDRVQGFYVSRPAPVADAVAVVDGGRPWHVPGGVPVQRTASDSHV